jgi:hypothetical protein
VSARRHQSLRSRGPAPAHAAASIVRRQYCATTIASSCQSTSALRTVPSRTVLGHEHHYERVSHARWHAVSSGMSSKQTTSRSKPLRQGARRYSDADSEVRMVGLLSEAASKGRGKRERGIERKRKERNKGMEKERLRGGMERARDCTGRWADAVPRFNYMYALQARRLWHICCCDNVRPGPGGSVP